MTRPGNRPPSASEQKLAASLAGAVDLSGLKKRAEAKRAPAVAPRAPGAATGPAAGPPILVEVDEASFEQEVLLRSTQVPVVVELMSRRAPTALTTLLSSLAEEAGGQWVHAVVDVDSAPGIAQAFQARAVPTVVAVAAGRPLADFEGEQPEDALRQWIAAVLQATEGKLSGMPEADAGSGEEQEEPADTERDAAEDALADGDLATAEERFTALVGSRPGDHTLLEALRYVQAARRATEESDAGEGTVSAALRAADRALVGGEYEPAFAVLVDAIRVSAGDDRATLRARLVDLLEALPTDDPRVLAARRNLANALY
ncbi:MAG: tetratricopeptide repeat protein [Dietzia sp.]